MEFSRSRLPFKTPEVRQLIKGPARCYGLLTTLQRPSPSPTLSSPVIPQFFHAPQYRYCSHSSSSDNGNLNPGSDSGSKKPSNTFTWPASESNEEEVFGHNMAPGEISQYLQQSHDRLFDHNRAWAAEQEQKDPEFFTKLSAGQSPEYLWIGCSDSRIPAEQICGLGPGEAFIHRNIANLVVNTDLNVMSVIEYAVSHLHVKHIIVCGHYGCGGVKAAMTPKDLGLLNPWLRNIRDVYRLHETELDAVKDDTARYNRLVELSVTEQCRNVIKTAAVQQSFAKYQYPVVHGWVFGFEDGLLKDLKVDHEDILHRIQKIYNLTDHN